METELICIKCFKLGKGNIVMNRHSRQNNPLYYVELPRKWEYFQYKIYCPKCFKELINQFKKFGLSTDLVA